MPSDTVGGSWLRIMMRARARLVARFSVLFKLTVPILVVGVVGTVFLATIIYRTEAGHIRTDFEERALLTTRFVELGVARGQFQKVDEDLIVEIQDRMDSLDEMDPSLVQVNAYALLAGEPIVIANSGRGLSRAPGERLKDAEEDLEAFDLNSALVEEGEVGGRRLLEVSLPIRISNEPAVVVGAYFSTAERDDALAALLRKVIVGAGATLVLATAMLFVLLHVLVLSRLRPLLTATERMRAGDYHARIEGANTPGATDEVVRLSSHFNDMAAAIQTLHDRLQDLATTDELTGLPNRRHVIQALEREIKDAKRHSKSLGAVMIDVDGFKTFNDRYGHAVGDDALRRVADALRGAVRASDLPARLGGDEFLVLLPDCDPGALRRTLGRVQREAGSCTVRTDEGEHIRVTVSAGGTLLKNGDTPETFVHRADVALYEAKRAGRDQVRVAA